MARLLSRRYPNPNFVRLTHYEAIGYVFVLPFILTLGLFKNYILTHAFKRVKIRSNLGRLLKILLMSDIIIWCLLMFYPLLNAVGIYANAHYAGTRPWNRFVLYFLQPALNTFFILNIHIVTMMAANQYLMYAFPRVHQKWKRKKYILKYVLIVDLFIIASMEYTMLNWLEVTRYRQSTSADATPKDIYYYDVVADPSDNYISYEVTNNLILVIAPLILLLFLSFSNLRYYLQHKWQQNITNGKKVSPRGTSKKDLNLGVRGGGGGNTGTGDDGSRQPEYAVAETASSTAPLGSGRQVGFRASTVGGEGGPTTSAVDPSTVPRGHWREINERAVARSKSDAKGVAEEKLLSILIIVLSFQYLICNIPIAIIQILYPSYECYPGMCNFRWYVLLATMLQLLNPNLDFYIFYALKSLRKAVGTLWTSTRRKKRGGGSPGAPIDKGPFYDSSSTIDELDEKVVKHGKAMALQPGGVGQRLQMIDEGDRSGNLDAAQQLVNNQADKLATT